MLKKLIVKMLFWYKLFKATSTYILIGTKTLELMYEKINDSQKI